MSLIIMNILAMSFELISSTVQSLRLLNYKFMEKFFFGKGVLFMSFKLSLARGSILYPVGKGYKRTR